MALIIFSKGGGQEYSVDTCPDLDDILPTMLVCKQLFAGKHLTILCKDLSGFILGNLKDYSLDTCSDLDDILPTMLVCKQFFFRNLVPRLIEFGPIVIDMNAG